MLRNLKVNLKSNWLKVQLCKKSNNNFKSNDIFVKEVLRNFESTKKNIKNNIYCDKMTTFNKYNKDNDDIRNVYKNF